MQKQILKQNTNKKDIEKSIQKKIKLIINNINGFKHLEKTFIQTNTRLVNEIIDLKRIHNLDYSFTDLLQEKELEDYSDVLEKYVPYDELTSYSAKLFHEGKIDNTDAMVLAHLPKPFANTENQNKIVQKIVDKEITAKEVLNSSKSELYDMVGEESNAFEENTKIILDAVYQMKHIAHRIIEHKKIINKSKYQNKIKENFYLLKNAIQFGLKIDLDKEDKK